jgi:hypothetical protein
MLCEAQRKILGLKFANLAQKNLLKIAHERLFRRQKPSGCRQKRPKRFRSLALLRYFSQQKFVPVTGMRRDNLEELFEESDRLSLSPLRPKQVA